MPLASPLLALALLAATSCPPVPPLARTFPDLARAEAELARAVTKADPACRAELELALGETRVAAGKGKEALAPLTVAVDGLPHLRGRAFAALGRAQVLASDPFEALHSFAMAERLLDPADPARTGALDAATLLARLYLRRGGSAWGAFRFDGGYRQTLKRSLPGAIEIAAGGDRIAVLGAAAVADLSSSTAEPLLTLEKKGIALAVDPLGVAAALAADGTLSRSDGARFRLELPGKRELGPGIGIALDHAGALALVQGGRVHLFAPDGTFRRTLAAPADAQAVAADGHGRLHVLRARDGGIALLEADGTPSREAAASGEGWLWKKADAIAADRAGGTWVLARNPGVVYLFDPALRHVGRIDPPADDRELLSRARSIAVDPSGDLYVLLSRDGTVVRYR